MPRRVELLYRPFLLDREGSGRAGFPFVLLANRKALPQVLYRWSASMRLRCNLLGARQRQPLVLEAKATSVQFTPVVLQSCFLLPASLWQHGCIDGTSRRALVSHTHLASLTHVGIAEELHTSQLDAVSVPVLPDARISHRLYIHGCDMR